MMFFSCKNRLFANYDIGRNEFCTVYAAGIGIQCFSPTLFRIVFLLIYMYTFNWFLNRHDIITNNDYTPRVVNTLSMYGHNKCWLLTVQGFTRLITVSGEALEV